MKRILTILVLTAILILGVFGSVALADESSVAFYNAADKLVNKLDGESTLFAEVSFESNKKSDVSIIAAYYNYKGELKKADTLASIVVQAGEEINYKTPALNVSGTDTLKIFAWNNYGQPVLTKSGIISKPFAEVASIKVNNVDGTLAENTVINGNAATADIPEGVALDEGATKLTLSLQTLDESASGIEADENEKATSVDIHVEGVAENNNIPIIVTVDSLADGGINKGNITLYHVESEGTKLMKEVASIDELLEHNQYFYDAENGTVTLALANFSEVLVVSDTQNAWNGNIATAFSSGTGTESDPYIIANADQLAYLSELISSDNDDYNTKYYKLAADINFGGEENYLEKGKDVLWYPVGYKALGEGKNAAGEEVWYTYGGAFKGTFDGAGHKISNLYQNTWDLDGNYDNGYYKEAMGIFGYVYNGVVKNLTVENFASDGEFTPTGCVAAYASNSTFENIALVNCNPRVYNTGNGGIVGIGGNTSDSEDAKLVFNNITIDNTNKITALWGSWDVACGGLVGMFRGPGHVYMTNCHVAAQIDVYNDVCGNYQYYWYRYAGMLVGTNKNMTTDANGYTVPETSKYHAENCTVHFGEWNDYYYCELVANSLASYTHDHQFSRLQIIDSLDEIKNGEEWTKTGNFLKFDGETKTCYHIVKDAEGNLKQHFHEDAGEETVNGETVLKEDKQIVYLPFNQLFTGYGWGVKHIPLGEFDGVTILDREVADSVVKFNSIANDKYGANRTITIGEMFEAIEGEVEIDADNVNVFVTPADNESTVSGTYTPNAEDWTKGTLVLTGEGNATITITDYYFCTPTTIEINVYAPVVATISGYSLDDATNIVTSFKGVLTFPKAVATGTDLSGIVITDGTTNYALTFTEGKVTDGTFTSASFVTPLLENGTKYTFAIPAIGENSEHSFEFTTIDAPYIISEEFNDSYTAQWRGKEETDLYLMSGLIDTDNDGKTDALKPKSGGSNTWINFPAGNSMDDVNELIIETRVKFTDGSNSGTPFILEDGSLKSDNDTNNGCLMVIRGNNHNNYSYHISTNNEGFLTYSVTTSNKVKVDRVVTDYKLYAGKWYTIRWIFSSDEKTYTLYVTDDDGNSINSTAKGYGFHSLAMTSLTDIRYSYNYYIASTVDYLRVWDNADLGEVTSTLDGATNVAKNGATATLTFANDITESDMEKITVGNGTNVVATLTDSRTVDLAISNLEWNTEYAINVPQLGANKADVFAFTTEPQPVPSLYINGTKIDGFENMALSFAGNIKFIKPVETGTDLSGITLSDGNDYYNLTITEGTATDGAFTTATFATPVLKAGRTYTMSFPAIGANEAKDITFTTVPLSYFVKEDFDGGYHAGWVGKIASANLNVLTDIDGDGVVDAMGPVGGDNNNYIKFPAYLSTDNVKALTIEARVKYKDRDGSFTLEDGSLKSNTNTIDGGLFTIRAKNTNDNKFQIRTSADGYLAYGGGDFTSHVSDYKIYNNTWYTIKLEFNETEEKAKVTITDDEGNSYEGPLMPTAYGTGYPINKISDLKFSYNWWKGSTIDYIYMYDANYEGLVDVTYNNGTALNGAKVEADDVLTVSVDFADAITEDQLSKITVKDANVSATLSEDGFSATLVIDGINKYEKTYSLVIPAFGLNQAKTVRFTTNAEPLSTKITQNKATINRVDNMPLAFSPTIEFLSALEDGTDLSGITIARADGEATSATITVTQGAVTDGYFTTANAVIKGLTQDTEYVITVPQIASNEEKTVTFTTIPAPYYIMEDVEDSMKYDWYTNTKLESRKSNASLKDTDGDGIKDSVYHDGSNHSTIASPDKISINTKGEVTYEFRAKYVPRQSTDVNEDGSLNKVDYNNGSLFRFYGNETYLYGSVVINTSGYMQYGSATANVQDLHTSDYKIYQNKWYTFKVTLNSTGSQMKVFVIDEDGNAFEGPYHKVYGANITGFTKAYFEYGWHIRSTVDYLRVWDNASELLGDTVVTYNEDVLLDEATNVPVEFDANITFESAITEEDMAKIAVSNGAEVIKTLSEDGLTVNLTGNLGYNTLYYINIPQLGNNKADVISFTSAGKPLEVVCDGMSLNGATEMPLDFVATVNFTDALAEDADLTGITIDGGNMEVVLADDRMSAELIISGLEELQKYTLSIPVFGDNSSINASFNTVSGDYIYRNEFNGTDALGYSLQSKTGESVTVTSGLEKIENGIFTLPTTNGGTTSTLIADEPAVITGYDKVVVETRIKYTNKNANEGGYVSSAKSLFGIYNVGFSQDVIALAAQSGKLYLGGLSDNAGVAAEATDYDYQLTDGAWYTIKYTISVGTDVVDIEIIPDDETQETLSIESLDLGNGYPLSKISHFQFGYRFQVKTEVDYIRIYPAPVVEEEVEDEVVEDEPAVEEVVEDIIKEDEAVE